MKNFETITTTTDVIMIDAVLQGRKIVSIEQDRDNPKRFAIFFDNGFGVDQAVIIDAQPRRVTFALTAPIRYDQ